MDSELNLSAHSGCAHPTEDALEEYAFERLSVAEAAGVEEHLLACSSCQTTLESVDEYILLMKQAAAETEAVTRRHAQPSRRIRIAAFGGTGAAIAMALALVVLRRAGPQIPVVPVQLTAFRGGDDAHVEAGRPLEITLDLSGLTPANGYRVEVVNAAGKLVWKSSAAKSSGASLSVSDPKPLKPGIYWVRLYSEDGKLLREFGLTANQN